MKMRATVAVLFASLCAVIPARAATEALRLAGRTEMPGYTGDFDHFEYDLPSRRLWLAAEDHGTLDVFDLKTGALRKSLRGVVDTPHGVFYLPQKKRLIVTDSGGKAMATRIIDGTGEQTFRLAAPAADAMAYDASTGRLYIVNGGRDAKMQKTYVSAVDPLTLKRLGDVEFDTDKVEAMAVEEKGSRLYVNVTSRNEMAVVDKRDLKVITTWPIKEAEQNAPLAFDEERHPLFVITRKPGKLIVLDA